MIRKVYESQYLVLEYEAEKNLIMRHWQPASEDMTEKMFKYEMLKLLDTVRLYRPVYLLGDTRNFNFIILPAVQEWCDERVYSEFGKLGVKKMAMINSVDYYAQLSVEQAIEESPKHYEVQYFDSQEEALEWLK